MNTSITLNNDKNGIEIRFDSKPGSEIIESLKLNGFRWSGRQKMWYSRQTPERIAFANSLNDEQPVSHSPINKMEKCCDYDLWEMTRTDAIEDNFEKYHIFDTKKIAAIIRRHLKERFPMCKWSVTKNSHKSIYVKLLSSPFDIDSDEIAAIVHYAYKFAESYNYDKSDIMADYFEVNFYGVYESDIVSKYDYEQREATVVESDMSNDFHTKKEAFDKAEIERKEREYQESIAKMKEAEEISKKSEAERKSNYVAIEENAEVKEVSYFVLNCDATNVSKEDSISGYMNDYDGDIQINHHCENCSISREVHFTSEIYNLFINQLLDYFSFLSGMGGSATDDRRITTMKDYEMMSAEERKTVEWYNYNCVAIFCDGELKLVVNPQGHSYAKYVFFVNEKSNVVDTYHTSYGIGEEENKRNNELAEELYGVSTDIILENGMTDTYSGERYIEYKKLIKNWIKQNEFPFSVGVVRAIKSENLKEVMYRLLMKPDSIQEQFKDANLIEGQRITIARIDDYGGMSVMHGHFKSFECGKYAQYDHAVKLVYHPKKSKNNYYTWLYRDVLIFDGWLEIPRELFWEKVTTATGLKCEKTRFLSFDRNQYDVVLDYFHSIGIKPVINTYKPQF